MGRWPRRRNHPIIILIQNLQTKNLSKMKKIQFMLVALFAVLSTNVFAAYTPGSRLTKGQKQTIDGIEYTVTSIYNTEDADEGQINTVSAAMNNFTGTAIEIPATVKFDVEGKDDTDPEDAAGGVAIKKEATFKVTKILDNGFKGLAGVTSLSIGKNVTEIGKTAFEGCENLATVTFEKGSLLATIGNGAFSYTSIESIDFTNCTKLVALGSGAKATGETGSPFTSEDHTTNIMLATVVLPTTCATINKYAFVGCTALSTCSLVKVTKIDEEAFTGCTSLASVVIGTTATAAISAINAKAFKGCTALLSVEFGTLAAAVVADDAFTGCTKLAEFSFNTVSGANTIGKKTSTSPYSLSSVRTVNFKKYISKWEGYTAGQVVIATGAFTDAFPAPTATAKNNIYYNAETVVFPTKNKDFYQPFADDAFAASATAARTITLTTSLAQFTNANGFATDDELLNKVKISAGYTEDFVIGYGDDKVLIQDKKNKKNYYYFANGANDFTIAKSQESGATVTVYQAYADVYKSAATLTLPDVVDIYFQPMEVIAGHYNIPALKTVIIKSNQEDGVEASPLTAGAYSTVVGAHGNMLDVTGEAYSALKVKTDLLNPGPSDLWFFNNPAKSGLGFTKYDASVQKGLAAGAVFLLTEKTTASARVNLIWLDDETTAIQKIQNTNKQEGAIYNLAGQKVSAAYKGVVIKDGKKYIQK
jgi:hypothetical protein